MITLMHLGHMGSYGNKTCVDTPNSLPFKGIHNWSVPVNVCFLPGPSPEGAEIGTPRNVAELAPGASEA